MTGRLGRLFNKIKDADYSLVYQPGATNYTADMLSRPEAVEANVVEMEFGSVVNWRAEQAADEVLKEITELVRMNEELVLNFHVILKRRLMQLKSFTFGMKCPKT